MKTTYTLFFFFFFVLSANAQIYVKHDATGMNNGSSWDNAYTDLSVALSSSSPNDQIWVSAGTYKPNIDSTTVDAFFTFPHDLELYGGFAGSESALSERDWETNETILSGDHDGNDADNDFDNNREENSKHVVWLTDTVTTASTIDGFTIRNGNTEPVAGTGNDRRGGGILTFGAPAIRNCHITQNYGYFGGGLYPRGNASDGTIIENCTIDFNSGRTGGGVYFSTNNSTITDCTFEGNIAGSAGGGVYSDNNNIGENTFTNCTFFNNEAITSRGGGLYLSEPRGGTVTNCTFMNNKALDSSGGGLQIRTDSSAIINISDCTFTDNDAEFGGAFGIYDEGTVANVTNCEFSSNTSIVVGGAVSNAFGATSTFTNCTFNENTSNGDAGALFSQNDGSSVSVNNCTFSINSSVDVGGAIAMRGDAEAGSTIPLPSLTVENTIFIFNIAGEQGGGIYISNSNSTITNSLLDNNGAVGSDGVGGGVAFNSSDTIHTSYSIMSTTIANNSASIGGGISIWREGTEGSTELLIQNTILDNPGGNNYEVEAGDPTVISNGGNLSSDGSALDIFIATNDLNGEDPLFVDASDNDYHLEDGSPCIDAGIATGAPLMDIEGMLRIDEIDMGAFENQKTINVKNLNPKFGKVNIFPNPVKDDLNFTFESNWNGSLKIEIINLEGKVIFSTIMDKNNYKISNLFSVKEFPSGTYSLSISNGKLSNTHQFIK